MAAVELPVQTVHRGELLLLPSSPSWPADGYVFDNDGETFVVLLNWQSTGDLTIHTARQVDGEDAANWVEEIPVYTVRVIGTFPTLDYNDENGQVKMTFEFTGNIWVAAYKLTSP